MRAGRIKAGDWFEQKLKEYEGEYYFELEGVIFDIINSFGIKMDKQNITRAELARQLEVSPAYISKILNGSPNFSLETLFKIARALGCDLQISLPRTKSKGNISVVRGKATSNGVKQRKRATG